MSGKCRGNAPRMQLQLQWKMHFPKGNFSHAAPNLPKPLFGIVFCCFSKFIATLYPKKPKIKNPKDAGFISSLSVFLSVRGYLSGTLSLLLPPSIHCHFPQPFSSFATRSFHNFSPRGQIVVFICSMEMLERNFPFPFPFHYTHTSEW